MKTEIISAPFINKPFPKLMISSGGTVVLFSGDGVGVVIIGDTINLVGNYSRTWNMKDFSDFNGQILITS